MNPRVLMICRHVLAPLFTEFHQRARDAGVDVQRFFSHLGRTYDMAIGITAMTEKRLQEIQASEDHPSSNPSFVSQALTLFRPAPQDAHALVRSEYLSHLDRLKGTVDTLIAENHIVCGNLDSLENILYTIHDHATTDELEISATKTSLESRFLALFRIHAPQLRRLQSSLETLDVLNGAREFANAQLTGSLQQLKDLSMELEDLRERIVDHEALIEADDVATLEFQVSMIQKSLSHMRAGKEKTATAKTKYLRDLQGQIDDNFRE